MKSYFKIIGFIELFLWIIGIISYSFYMGSVFSKSDDIYKVILILTLLLIIIIGPSLGFLFISYSNIKEENLSLHIEIEDLRNEYKKTNDDLTRKYAELEWEIEDFKRKNNKEN